MEEFLGLQLGNYRLQQVLGHGGFADVYLGEHIHLHMQVAIKVLRIRLAAESLKDFLHEAQVVAQLYHPHIVRVFEFDVAQDIPYLVMTYAPFGSLRQRFVRGIPSGPAQVLPYVQQAASALQYAHDKKLIHRDIKPENILLGPRGEVLLSDFGLVLLAQSSSSVQTEGLAGTIAYMAPEQIRGKPRLASDQYALGITVYEWLCGEKPFNGHFVEIASQHMLAAPPSLCQRVPGLAPTIEAVVFKALAKTPEARYPSVQAFADALTDAVQHAGKVGSTNLLISDVLPDPPTPVAIPLPSTPRNNEGEQTNDGTVLREIQQTILAAPQAPLLSPSEEAISTAPGLQAQLANPLTPIPTQVSPTSLATDTPPPSVTKKAKAARPSFAEDRHADRLERKRRPRRKLFIQVASILGVLLLCTGIALTLFQADLFNAFFPATSASITVTPDSQGVQATSTVQAVTGTPDPARSQVQARMLSATSSVSSSAIPASGKGHSDATYAHGTVYGCYRGAANIGDTETISAGTMITAVSYVAPDSAGHVRTIKLLSPITVLRSPATSGVCSGFVQAAYVYPGPVGNIKEYTTSLGAESEPFTGIFGDVQFDDGIGNDFTGGQDAQDYTYVQQSDIDQATNNLASHHVPNTQPLVSTKLRANERLIGTPTCQTPTSTDHAVNDHAASVTATTTSTCSGEAYDYTGAVVLANQHLRAQASADLRAGYGFQGATQVTLQSASPAQNGTVQLTFLEKGTLVYQVSTTQKLSWQQALKGKQKNAAETWLRGQPGIKSVNIVLRGWNQQVLPASARNITIIVASPD